MIPLLSPLSIMHLIFDNSRAVMIMLLASARKLTVDLERGLG